MNDAQGQLTAQMIDESVEVMQELFRQVRPLIMERAGKIDHTDKQDGSPVTDTDIEVEDILQVEFARRFPGLPVFGEETGYGSDLPEIVWLIDPIDGTSSFIQNVPAFTSMAVLLQHGEATASIIYNHSLDTMYVARKGKGAYKNGIRLNLGTIPLPQVAYCKGRFIDALNDLLRPEKVTCQNGPQGAGYGFALVAEGLAAARFNLLSRGYVHDYAPGALLVREAGGAIVPIQDDAYTYETRSFVACHPALESLIRSHAQKIRALEKELAD